MIVDRLFTTRDLFRSIWVPEPVILSANTVASTRVGIFAHLCSVFVSFFSLGFPYLSEVKRYFQGQKAYPLFGGVSTQQPGRDRQLRWLGERASHWLGLAEMLSMSYWRIANAQREQEIEIVTFPYYTFPELEKW